MHDHGRSSRERVRPEALGHADRSVPIGVAARASVIPEVASNVNASCQQVAASAGASSKRMEDMTVTRRYTFKLYPNSSQESALQRQAALCASLWNAALEQREIQWAHECQRKSKGERKGIGYYDQAKDLKFIRSADPEYAAMSCGTLELTLKALDLAFQAFFKRAKGGAGKSAGYPQYKSTRYADTIPHRDGKGWKLSADGKNFKVYAKGIPGQIKARGKFPIEPTEIRTMTLMRREGAWWASIVVFMDERRNGGYVPIEINLDLIDQFAEVKNAGNGECIPSLAVGKFRTKEQTLPRHHGLANHQMEQSVEHGDDAGDRRAFLSLCTMEQHVEADIIQSVGDRRFKRGSYRWKKERQRVARLRAKQSRQRSHNLHVWTASVIRQAKEIEVLTPPVKDLTKSAKGTQKNPGAAVDTVAKVNRQILEYAPASAIAMLEYKAAEAGILIAVRTVSEHPAYIGQDISKATKAAKKLRHQLKRIEL